jgi:hypothetical protein
MAGDEYQREQESHVAFTSVRILFRGTALRKSDLFGPANIWLLAFEDEPAIHQRQRELLRLPSLRNAAGIRSPEVEINRQVLFTFS